MADINFVVKKVYPGTENQRKAGIYATFGIDIVVEGTTVVSLADYKLCKNRAGEMYIQSPYREYEKKGAEPGAKQKIYFAKLFPNERDNLQQQGIIEQVKRECEGGPANRSTPTQRTGGGAPYSVAKKPMPARDNQRTATEGW